MIRIGFDPGFEVQQEHKALIRQNELLRLAHEGIPQSHSRFINVSRFLALLGKEITNLGTSLESRYADRLEDQITLDAGSTSSGCAS